MLEHLETRRLLAAAGELDPTFSGDGRAPLPFGPGTLVGLQPDGKIVHTREESNGIRLGRLNSNGTNDTSFLGGQTLTQTGTRLHNFDVNKSNGRIAMVADDPVAGDGTRVAVFNADGTPRAEFDHDGVVNLDLGYVAHRIAWQGDKLIILGGLDDGGIYESGRPMELRRLNADGTLDQSFGSGGKVVLPGNWFVNSDLAIGPNGQINVAVTHEFTIDLDAHRLSYVERFTADGAVDTTFAGGSGVVNVDARVEDGLVQITAFHVGDDGSIYTVSNTQAGVIFRRFAPDGAIAATSGALQAAITSFHDGWPPSQIELQRDGKVLLFGMVPTSVHENGQPVVGWQIVRLFSDGQIDTTYGAGGVALPHFAFPYNGRALVQGDGKVLVAGDRFGPDGPEVGRIDSGELNVGVVRLNRKGTLLVYGTSKGEDISVGIRGRDGKFIARVGNLAVGFAPSKIKRIAIFASAGNDVVTIGNGVKGAYAQGDDGSDILNGGAGDDVLVGGLQPDQIFGNDGNDKLAGEGGNDYLLGGAGKDDLFGAGGRDTLSGAGGNDRLFGGGDADRCLGGNGTDAAAMSTEDEFSGIERFLDSP